jgi:hypothetical protein
VPWMAAMGVAWAECPDRNIDEHMTELGSATAQTREEAETAAGSAAKEALTSPWCTPAPGSYWCRRVLANTQITEATVSGEGRSFSACALAAIHRSFVEELTAEKTLFEGSVGDLAQELSAKIKKRRVRIEWRRPIPDEFPLDWLDVTLQNALGEREILPLLEGAVPGDPKLVLTPVVDQATGGFVVSACLGQVNQVDCDERLRGLTLPNLSEDPVEIIETGRAKPGLWIGMGSSLLVGITSMLAGAAIEVDAKSDLRAGARTYDDVLRSRTPANAAYVFGYAGLAGAAGFGLALTFGGER